MHCPCGGGGVYYGGGGGEAIVQGVITIGSVIGALFTTVVVPATVSWFNELIQQGKKALSEAKAYARTIESQEKYHVHHIVAKEAYLAAPARGVLESVGIDPLTHGLNLAVIPESVHSSLHTASYYYYVNRQFSGLHYNEEAIIKVLVRLQLEIQIYCETGVKAW